MTDEWRTLRNQSYLSHIAVPDLFSAMESARVIGLCSQHPPEPGRTWNGTEYVVNAAGRSVETAYIARSAETAWIYDRMDEAFLRLAKVWGFDVRCTLEDLKYVRYQEGAHFMHWHMDTGPDYSNLRKLSMSVELNDSSEYEGGELQIFPIGGAHIAGPHRAAGTAVVFPSHSYHRVTPVTRGVRHVLVNWISGPPLR